MVTLIPFMPAPLVRRDALVTFNALIEDAETCQNILPLAG